MSRVGKQPVTIPSGVEVVLNDRTLRVKGRNEALETVINDNVIVEQEDSRLVFSPSGGDVAYWPIVGTMRSVVSNMVHGVSTGFEKRLNLVGVGYRAQLKGQTLNLALGFSHPIDYPIPAALSVETPSQTEIVIRGADKQLVGQVAAEIRRFRPPEPYKGKGVKYADEQIIRKEAKKK